MLQLRSLALTLMILLGSFAAQAQIDVIRIKDDAKKKNYVIREGDWLDVLVLADSSRQDGKITYIGEKGVQLNGHTYRLEEIRLISCNSHRREVTANVTDFAGESFMFVGGLVFRAGIEIISWDEKAAVVIGMPVLGVGGALWLTGAIAHGLVYPVLQANTSWKISDNYSAELASGPKRRWSKPVSPGQPVTD